MTEKKITITELREIAVEWQKRLRLQDWKLKIVLAPKVITADECSGQVNWSLQHKKAWIDIYTEDLEQARKTLIHELIHLYWAGIEKTHELKKLPGYLDAHEIALNCLCAAFFDLRYK